jgi:hypothetical protein
MIVSITLRETSNCANAFYDLRIIIFHFVDPIILDTGVTIVSCNWNHNGSILALAGSTVLTGQTVECNVVQFYTPFGEVFIQFHIYPYPQRSSKVIYFDTLMCNFSLCAVLKYPVATYPAVYGKGARSILRSP